MTLANLPSRKSTRLKGYDYSREGSYFVTVCTKFRVHHFGVIKNGILEERALGALVRESLLALPNQFINLRIDAYVIMPNHLHCILTIVGAGLAPARNFEKTKTGDLKDEGMDIGGQGQALPLHAVIGAFKSITANRIRKEHGVSGLWHRNYHEHIIRDHEAYLMIREYIRNNPARWEEDRFYGVQG